MLFHGRVSDVIETRWTYKPGGWIDKQINSINKNFFAAFNKEDTVLLIFNRDQKEKLDFLEKEKKEWIVYKSPECKNSVHPNWSRNTLVILEKPE